jgi:hypothetical protein
MIRPAFESGHLIALQMRRTRLAAHLRGTTFPMQSFFNVKTGSRKSTVLEAILC